MPLPEIITVNPAGKLEGEIYAQASKNYLTRYLWTSGLADGVSELSPVVASDDARAMVKCLGALGAEILEGSLEEGRLVIRGFGANPRSGITLNPDNAGAVLRFLLGVTALAGPYRFETDRMDSLGTRPNIELIEALAGWGVTFNDHNAEGTLPLESALDVTSNVTNARDHITVRGDRSSQFLSSLLLVAPVVAAKRGSNQLEVAVEGELVSRPAVETTLDVMKRRGIEMSHTLSGDVSSESLSFKTVGQQRYEQGEFRVNGDWPGAAGILCAAAALPESQVTISGLLEDAQGERRILDVLKAMGCRVIENGEQITLHSPQKLKGLGDAPGLDGDPLTDAIPPLMAVCALAEGPSRIYNVHNLRLKECDRISDPLREFAKLGIQAEEEEAGFTIIGNPDGFKGGLELEGYKDHRVIFAMTILGMRCENQVTVTTADHVAKSYPGFFDDLKKLGAQITP